MSLSQIIRDFFEYDEVPWKGRMFSWHTWMLIVRTFKFLIPAIVTFFLGIWVGTGL